jgi:acetyl esterase/lipase
MAKCSAILKTKIAVRLMDRSGLPGRVPISSTVLIALVIALRMPVVAQESSSIEWATSVSYGAQLYQNIVYQKANALELKLDVITKGSQSRPVVIFFHGGGWVQGKKENHLLKLLPYLAHGMNGVNIEYRVANEAQAPAAVEDCRCALHWVVYHAKEYGFDPAKIVVTGESAGGHLALMTGMLTAADGFDNSCELPPDKWSAYGGAGEIKVAAIVNFFGITDLVPFLTPSNPSNFVVRWLGGNRPDLARRLSPMTYVRNNSPPIISVHGEKDPVVPYEQAARLHQALDRAGAKNQLVTVPGGGHGGYSIYPWTSDQNGNAYKTVFEFLEKNGVPAK